MQPATPQLLRIDAGRPQADLIAAAAQALAGGGLVVLPTETVYGLAADPRQPGAMAALYEAKGRPDGKPVTLMAAEVERVAAEADLGAAGRALARAFWPGPLTLVLPAGGEFSGFRVPDHAVARALVRAAGGLLAVTSANRSGEPAAVTAAEAAAAVGRFAAVILDGGPAAGGVASTVVRLSGGRLEILREGALTKEEIERAAGMGGI